jgi:hypothetical protein
MIPTMTLRLSRMLIVLPLVALAACGAPGGSRLGDADSSDVVESPTAQSGDQTAALPPVDRRKLTPEGLKGLHAVQVEDALGTPSFRRRDPPAEIWQYRMGICTLDLFLYKEGGRTTVSHYAVRVPGGGTMSERACLDEVLRRGEKKPIS